MDAASVGDAAAGSGDERAGDQQERAGDSGDAHSGAPEQRAVPGKRRSLDERRPVPLIAVTSPSSRGGRHPPQQARAQHMHGAAHIKNSASGMSLRSLGSGGGGGATNRRSSTESGATSANPSTAGASPSPSVYSFSAAMAGGLSGLDPNDMRVDHKRSVLNSYIYEYLHYYGFSRTAAAFREEQEFYQRVAVRPSPSISSFATDSPGDVSSDHAHSVHGGGGSSVHSSWATLPGGGAGGGQPQNAFRGHRVHMINRFLALFDAGECVRFFELWERYASTRAIERAHQLQGQGARADTDSTTENEQHARAAKLEFHLHVFFAIFPQLPSSRRKDEEKAAMARFQHYLQEEAKTVAQLEDVGSFFALPFVGDIAQHPQLKKLLQPVWVKDLRTQLATYLTVMLPVLKKPRLHMAVQSRMRRSHSVPQSTGGIVTILGGVSPDHSPRTGGSDAGGGGSRSGPPTASNASVRGGSAGGFRMPERGHPVNIPAELEEEDSVLESSHLDEEYEDDFGTEIKHVGSATSPAKASNKGGASSNAPDTARSLSVRLSADEQTVMKLKDELDNMRLMAQREQSLNQERADLLQSMANFSSTLMRTLQQRGAAMLAPDELDTMNKQLQYYKTCIDGVDMVVLHSPAVHPSGSVAGAPQSPQQLSRTQPSPFELSSVAQRGAKTLTRGNNHMPLTGSNDKSDQPGVTPPRHGSSSQAGDLHGDPKVSASAARGVRDSWGFGGHHSVDTSLEDAGRKQQYPGQGLSKPLQQSVEYSSASPYSSPERAACLPMVAPGAGPSWARDKSGRVRVDMRPLHRVEPLDFDRLKGDLIRLRPNHKAAVLQALRWRVCRASASTRLKVLQQYNDGDLLELRGQAHVRRRRTQRGPGVLFSKCLFSESAFERDSTARLIDVLATFSTGREYLSQLPSFMELVFQAATREPSDNTIRQKLLSVMQKFSLS